MQRKQLKLSKPLAVLFASMGLAFSSSFAENYPTPDFTAPSTAYTFPSKFHKMELPADVGGEVADADAPQVAEWTRSNKPGDTMILTGERFTRFTGDAEGRDTHFAFYGEGVGTNLFKNGLVQRLAGRQVAVTLPSNLPADQMYFVWPRNDKGFGNPVAINKTDVWWIGPDRLTAGRRFSVYGRNLNIGNVDGQLYIEELNRWIPSVSANPYKVDFILPPNIANGTYHAWFHNGYGAKYGWSKPVTVTVGNGLKWSSEKIINVTAAPYNAKGDGSTDDYAAVSAAFDAAEAGDTVYFPAGTYMLGHELKGRLHNKRVLGDGMDLTVIKKHPSSPDSQLIYGGAVDAEIRDLTFSAGTGGHGGYWLMRSLSSGGKNDLTTFSGVRFTQEETSERGGLIEMNWTSNVLFTNCEFRAGGSLYIGDSTSRQIFFEDCNFVGMFDLNNYIAANGEELSIEGCTMQNFDNSDATNGYGWCKGRWIVAQGLKSHGGPDNWYFGGNETIDLCPRRAAPRAKDAVVEVGADWVRFRDLSGLSTTEGLRLFIVSGMLNKKHETIKSINKATGVVTITRPWARQYGRNPQVGDIIELKDGIDTNSGEAILAEAMASKFRGRALSGTEDTVKIEGLSVNYTGHIVTVVVGTGLGQTREISGYNRGTITVAEPWNVIPDSNSILIIGPGLYRLAVYGNHFDGTENSIDLEWDCASTGVEPYGMNSDWIIDGNSFESLRQGISEFGMVEPHNGVYIVQPNYFNYIANNTMSNCYVGIERNLGFHRSASSYYRDPLVLGTMFRENKMNGCVRSAISCKIEDHSKTEDFIEMTVWDKNSAHDCDELLLARDGFFNQIWVGNNFSSAKGGIALTHFSENTPVLRDNTWSGFSEVHGGVVPGALLELPNRYVSLGTNNISTSVSVHNSGTEALTWKATCDSEWLNVSHASGIIRDESSEGAFVLKVDADQAPAEESEAIVTVSSDDGQVKQLTAVYDSTSSTGIEPPTTEPPAPILTKIKISGPTAVDAGTKSQYTCTAIYSDNSVKPITPTWSETTPFGSIDSEGLLTAGDVANDEDIVITASFEGKTTSFDIVIKEIPPVFERLQILGAVTVNEGSTAQYSAVAIYSDGTSVQIDPLWSDTASGVTISSSGVLSAGSVSADKSIQVIASHNGYSTRYSVIIKNLPAVLERISINGSNMVKEGSSESYTCSANYSDGSSKTIVPGWNLSSSDATIDATGNLLAGDVTSSKTIVLTAVYGGKIDTHSIQIKDVVTVPESITISGPQRLEGGKSATYTCTLISSDGSSKVVTPTWSDNSVQATVNSDGRLIASRVTANENMILTASYNGLTATYSIALTYVEPVNALLGISIEGPAVCKENTITNFNCVARYSDGSIANVAASWSILSPNATINASGVFVAGNIESDTSVSITASFGGETARFGTMVEAVLTHIIYPLSGFEGKTVRAKLWDENAQEWIELGEMVNPSELVIENIPTDQWYWISVYELEEASGNWVEVHGNWISL